MAKTIDFWFSIGSTYTFLSVMRLDQLSEATGVKFNWCPFNVRTIMSEVGNRPFSGKPVKLRYMWRDIERRAKKYGMSAQFPAPYPLAELDRANLVAALAKEEGWCEDYVRTTYQRWFQDGLEPGSERQLSEVLPAIGQDTDRVIGAAASERVESFLVAATDRVREIGIFGSPSFLADGELFWGDDRLEDAIEHVS